MKRLLVLSTLLVSLLISWAQDIPEHISYSRVYEFLDELATDGFIRLNSTVKPYSRTFIAMKLLEAESKDKVESYREEVRLATYNLENQVRYRLAEAMVGDIIREFRTPFQSLGKEAQSVFDDSLIKDMAERGEDIFKCAIYLFANYVDLDTTFAEGHGGDGGGSDLPWGRKEDEDDRTWARRCLQRAHRMMKPAGGKSVRKK